MKNLLTRLRAPKNDSGLTLVELVVSMFIFGLVSLLIFNVFQTTNSTAAAVQGGTTSVATAQIATQELTKEVRTSVIVRVSDTGKRLDIEKADGSCMAWHYLDGKLYTYKGATKVDSSEDWFVRISGASLASGKTFFSTSGTGVAFSFVLGEGAGKVELEGDPRPRVKSDRNDSVCFGGVSPDPSNPTPTPTPTPTTPPVTTYSITYDLAGGLASNPSGYTNAAAAFTLTNPTRDGYTFAGWTGTGLSFATNPVTIPTGSTGNRAYTATWSENSFSISYNLAGGTAVGANPTSYSSSTSAFTLTNPTRSGYNFAGWTGTGLSSATTSVSVASGSSGDRTYTATWTTTPVTPPASDLTTTIVKTNGWGNASYQYTITIKNNSSTPVTSGWKLVWSTPGAHSAVNWSGTCSVASTVVTCINASWAGTIPAGGTRQVSGQVNGSTENIPTGTTVTASRR